jgi:hypothetical protein
LHRLLAQLVSLSDPENACAIAQRAIHGGLDSNAGFSGARGKAEHSARVCSCDRKPAVAPALARLGNVGLEQNPRLQDLGGGVLAFADQGFEGLSFFWAETDDVFLTATSDMTRFPPAVDDVARESWKPVRIKHAAH